MKNREKEVFIILIIGIITTTFNLACSAQNERILASMKERSLCILEETEDSIIYLTSLTRIVQNLGDENKYYAGGEEIFLLYEILTISKDEEETGILNCTILHCKPERIATPDGGNYDTATFYMLPKSATFYKNGEFERQSESEKKWKFAGMDNDGRIANKITDYYEKHRDTISTYQEDLNYYKDNFW